MQTALTFNLPASDFEGYLEGKDVSVIHGSTFTAGVYHHLQEAGPLTAAQVTAQLFPMLPINATEGLLQKLAAQGWLTAENDQYHAASLGSEALAAPLPAGQDLRLDILEVSGKHFATRAEPCEGRSDLKQLGCSIASKLVPDKRRKGVQYSKPNAEIAVKPRVQKQPVCAQLTVCETGYTLQYNGMLLEENGQTVSTISGQSLDAWANGLWTGDMPCDLDLDTPTSLLKKVTTININGERLSIVPVTMRYHPGSLADARMAFNELAYKRRIWSRLTEEQAQDLWSAKPDYWEFAFEEVFPEF